MGNTPGKQESADSSQKNLDIVFNVISNNKNSILRKDLRNTWSSEIDQDFYTAVENYLFKNQNELSFATFKKFYHDLCKGETNVKVAVLFEMMGEKNAIPGSKMSKFVTSVFRSILKIQQTKSPKRYNSWSSRMPSGSSPESVNELSNYFLSQIQKTSKDEFTEADLRTLLIYLDFFLIMVLSRLYDTEDKHFYTGVLPKWKYSKIESGKNLDEISVLDMFKILFVNYELPFDFQHEWRILYSTSIHGESFSMLSSEIINNGATVIIVKDKDGHIFGGFASQNWKTGPTFYGDARCFLFTLYPKMNVHPATNFNNNFQYMNSGQQTMPNGLGMGGRLEYCGMWISAEFGKGHCSETCTTFRNYKMMSSTKEFQISHLEVWGVGTPPSAITDLGERSVLDSNAEAKALLDMAGKTAYSEGLREKVDN